MTFDDLTQTGFTKSTTDPQEAILFSRTALNNLYITLNQHTKVTVTTDYRVFEDGNRLGVQYVHRRDYMCVFEANSGSVQVSVTPGEIISTSKHDINNPLEMREVIRDWIGRIEEELDAQRFVNNLQMEQEIYSSRLLSTAEKTASSSTMNEEVLDLLKQVEKVQDEVVKVVRTVVKEQQVQEEIIANIISEIEILRRQSIDSNKETIMASLWTRIGKLISSSEAGNAIDNIESTVRLLSE